MKDMRIFSYFNKLNSFFHRFFPVLPALSARRLCVGVLFGVCSLLSLSPCAAHAENERYKAFPMSPGGYVFILDTKEGHAWVWSNTGREQVSPSGKNPRIVYQGNVRKNMTPPKQPASPQAAAPSAQAERY